AGSAAPELSPLSLPDALPISRSRSGRGMTTAPAGARCSDPLRAARTCPPTPRRRASPTRPGSRPPTSRWASSTSSATRTSPTRCASRGPGCRWSSTCTRGCRTSSTSSRSARRPPAGRSPTGSGSSPRCDRARSAPRRRLPHLAHVEVGELRRLVAELAEARGELGGLAPARVLHRRLVGGELHDVVVAAGPVAVGGDRAPQGAGRAAVVEAGADLLPERLDLVHAGRVHLDDLDEPGHR